MSDGHNCWLESKTIEEDWLDLVHGMVMYMKIGWFCFSSFFFLGKEKGR